MIEDAVFLGDGTLLVRCAELFRQAGGRIAGVVTSDPQVSAWAEAEGLARFGTCTAPDAAIPRVDYLFSIANVAVIPTAVLAKARKMAINFHDGPLPARAGLNVPAWAILEGETEHGIAWHQMTEEVDGGGILRDRRFPILPTDTAFTLNARCYEAGIDAFRDLLADLEFGRPTPRPAQTPLRVHARADRPAALGTLDLTRSAGELCRQVRALNFGGYANPLGLAKLWTGDQVLTVGRLEIVTDRSGDPGLVLVSDEATLTVAVTGGAVRLSDLGDLHGARIDPRAARLVPGRLLPRPLKADAIEPKRIGRAEPGWAAALGAGGAALPPYARAHDAPAGTIPLDAGGADARTLTAAWMAWTAGQSGTRQATIAWLDAAPAAPWLSALRPVTVNLADCATPQAALDAVEAALDAALARAPMAADLPLRAADAAARAQGLAALRVVVSADGGVMPPGTELKLHAAAACIEVAAGVFAAPTLARLAADFGCFLAAFRANPGVPLATLPLGATPAQAQGAPLAAHGRLAHEIIADMARLHPEAPALEADGTRLDRAELDRRAAILAGALAARGAGPGTVVGLCLDRSADLVVAMLAILRTGAAYLPLDPAYPADRLRFMLKDSGAALVVASAGTADRFGLAAEQVVDPQGVADPLALVAGAGGDLAYLIYTSGSTGLPKGVAVTHRNVAAFLAAMDEAIPMTSEARLLAVTSVSFDISVLEILWTLSRGATVVLQTDRAAGKSRPDFSMFYFASEASGTGHHAYRLLLEGARFADENGFEAIWTPERHFHAFGGLYPNPAISAAALAGITRNVKLRAGSSVVPLHHPVRVAEDWALVDNLSNGRAGVAIAAGWQPNDFLLRPESWGERKQVMLESVETLRALWRGEKLAFPGPDGKPVEVEIHPRPMQGEIPLWLTAAGNPETFVAAGRMGCGVLTHLLGQTFDEVAEKIRSYRIARAEAGHEGPGHVVLMLHTFIGETEDAVREAARGPMKSYLKSAVDLVRRAAWTFPTIVERAGKEGLTPQEMFEREPLSAQDLDQLLDHAFERYYQTSGLFGTPDSARQIVRSIADIGVDEIGCLIDFGIDTDTVLANLPNIRALMTAIEAEGGVGRKASVAEDVVTRGITHLQCTPSMAAYLAADDAGHHALGHLDVLMVGGEAFPPDLARDLGAHLKGRLYNMYGPTETTVWSAVEPVEPGSGGVPVGLPIAGTSFSVRTAEGLVVPDMVEGELWIGGAGVAQGYWRRPELTIERFMNTPQGRFYRTGDLVRRRPDGRLDFLGRIDGQVKIRGYRIETGEIEALLAGSGSVRAAAVRAVVYGDGDTRLIAYVTAGPQRPDPVALREMLAERLPEFMLPSQIMVLDRMPLTPNGKIDRKALPLPSEQVAAGEQVAAENDLEADIAEIWREALGLDSISVTGNFFDLGGHSLLVVQVQRRMKEVLGRDVAITDLFRFPTVRSVAAHLSGEASDGHGAAGRGAARAAARVAARMGRR